MAGPNLTSPANASTGAGLLPAFAWSEISGAGSYEIQIARETSFQNIVMRYFTGDEGLDLKTLVGSHGYPLDFGMSYYWRVRSIANNVPGDWSATFSFQVEEKTLPYTPEVDHRGKGRADMLEQFKERG
jgi:hypothetical protein